MLVNDPKEFIEPSEMELQKAGFAVADCTSCANACMLLGESTTLGEMLHGHTYGCMYNKFKIPDPKGRCQHYELR